MMVYITSINFNYESGFEEGFGNVALNFQTVGQPYNISGKIVISKADYMAATGIDELRQKVKDKIIADLSEGA